MGNIPTTSTGDSGDDDGDGAGCGDGDCNRDGCAHGGGHDIGDCDLFLIVMSAVMPMVRDIVRTSQTLVCMVAGCVFFLLVRALSSGCLLRTGGSVEGPFGSSPQISCAKAVDIMRSALPAKLSAEVRSLSPKTWKSRILSGKASKLPVSSAGLSNRRFILKVSRTMEEGHTKTVGEKSQREDH